MLAQLRLPFALFVFLPVIASAQVGPNLERLDCVDRLGDVAVRWDGETGTFASLSWATPGEALLGSSPEAAVCRWLEQDLGPLLDAEMVAAADDDVLPGVGPSLVHLVSRDLGNDRSRVDLQQQIGGVPVLASGLQVELELTAAGPRVVAVRGRYFPDLPWELPAPSAQVEADLAQRFPSFTQGELSAQTSWTQVVVPEDGGARLAFAVDFAPTPSQAWRVLVDAVSGEELSRSERCCQAVARGQVYGKNPGDTPRASLPLTDLYVFQGANRVTTDDKGVHPLAGMVSLDDGLAGPLLRVFVSEETELAYTGPADLNLNPNEAENDQDELAAWHHLIDFNRHLQSTYARFKDSQAATTRFAIVVRFKEGGQPLANAFFSNQNVQAGGDSFPGFVAMGTFGGREAARSSSVVQHEYSHALYSEIVQLSGTLQAGGLNEGLSDYLPAAFKDDPLIGGWLTNPAIRDLRRDFSWPQDNNNEVHRVGHIFAGALWDARLAAAQRDPDDRLRIDQAVVEGIFRLRDQPNLIDAREAVLAGDQVANDGAFRVTLTEAFFDHGVGPAAENEGPTVAPVTSTNVVAGQTLDVVVEASDPDGDPLALSASSLDNASFDPVTNTFSFSPDTTQLGAHQVTFTASDEVLSDSRTVTFDVEAPPPPPAPTGGVAPVASNADPTGTARRSGGGGGGGCALAPSPGQTPAGGLLGLAFLLLAVARRRAGSR